MQRHSIKISALSFILSFVFQATGGKGPFNWTISIVRLVKVNDVSRLVNVGNVTCRTDNCLNIYARVKALHNIGTNDVNEFRSVTEGINPIIMMKVKHRLKEELHFVDPLVVNSDNCLCLQTSSFNWVSSSLFDYTCLNSTKVCERVFIAPIPITKETISCQIAVEAKETSLYAPRKSVKFYNIEKYAALSQIFHEKNVSISLPKNLIRSKVVPEESKFWAFLLGNYVFLSSNEWETTKTIKLSLAKLFPELCSAWHSDAKDILSLPDRFLIASKFGLIEQRLVNGIYLAPRIVSSRCITTIETLSQSSLTNFYVMALSNDTTTFYFGRYHKGSAMDIKIALDRKNRTICQAVKNSSSEGCCVISCASSYTQDGSLYVLVKSRRHLLVKYSINSSSYVILQDLSHERLQHMPMMVGTDQSTSYSFDGLSFTQLYADYLFIWGNILLYSPNAGQRIMKIIDLKDDLIQLFTTSHHGYFAFITKSRRIFFGKVGAISIRKLTSIDASSALTIFFDSIGNLCQILLASSKRIKKTLVPIKDALNIENVYTKLINSQRCCSKYHGGRCKEDTMSCTSGKLEKKKLERRCPFAKVQLQTFDSQHFSRVASVQHCRDRISSHYVTKMNDVNRSLFRSEKIRVGSNASYDCLWGMPFLGIQQLPRALSLGRGACYDFTIEVFLNHGNLAEFYSHNFQMDHLQLSVTDPKPEELLTNFSRAVNYTKDSVEFKVKLCDSGRKRKQNSPGIGQQVVSPEIKVVGSGLDCIARSYKDSSDIEGYFTVKVFLGCPAGQKVVFDPKATKSQGGNYFCIDDLPGVSCFHYYHEFSPVFKHVDEATLQTKIFTGNYTLMIVKGGRSLDQLREFNAVEQRRYNFEPGSSLIWAPSVHFIKKPIFQGSVPFSWLCSSSSPCSQITPEFPNPPVYYFVIEFSNRDVDYSNCDFTFQFTIKVEGIAPGSINPSLIIVLSSIGVLIIGLLICFALRKRYSHILSNLHLRDIFRLPIKLKKWEDHERPAKSGAVSGSN